jgi:hypothetical protein
VFDFLCFNLGNSDNESEGECVSIRGGEVTIAAIDSIDGRTIPCIHDVGASPMEDPSYHSRGLEMESHFGQNDNSEVSPYMLFLS